MDNNYQPQTPSPQPQYNQNAFNSSTNGTEGGQNGSSGLNNIPPKNYLAFAIFTTICCCLPTGIYAIIRSTKVNSYYAMGQYALAMKASEDAKQWSIIGLVLGIIANIISFACGVFSNIMQYM